MTFNKLALKLSLVALGLFAVNVLYGFVFNVLLRPISNAIVESQLGNSNAAPTVTLFYNDAALVILIVCNLVLLLIGIKVVIGFVKEKGKE